VWHGGVATDAVVLRPTVDTAWEIAAIGRVFDELSPDLVWRNSASGQSRLGRAAGGLGFLVVVHGPASDLPLDANWEILGFEDYLGVDDGALLLRNRQDGALGIAWFNGFLSAEFELVPVGTTRAQCCLLGTPPALTWSVAGSGDFDGNGSTDILWRDPATGANALWQIHSDVVDHVWVVDPTSLRGVAPRWQVAGIGDFNGDGRADILWRDPSSGANVLWFSGQATSVRRLASVALPWRVATILDLDGDGHSDIVWRNPVTGANVAWHSGNRATQVVMTAVTNPAWQIVP
jgi:hypothetical protein